MYFGPWAPYAYHFLTHNSTRGPWLAQRRLADYPMAGNFAEHFEPG